MTEAEAAGRRPRAEPRTAGRPLGPGAEPGRRRGAHPPPG